MEVVLTFDFMEVVGSFKYLCTWFSKNGDPQKDIDIRVGDVLINLA